MSQVSLYHDTNHIHTGMHEYNHVLYGFLSCYFMIDEPSLQKKNI